MSTKTSMEITAETKQAEAALASLDKAFRGVAGSIENLPVVGAALAAVFSVDAFQGMVRASIDAQDHLNDLSKSTSLSVETLAGLGAAARKSGSNLDDVAAKINKLSVNIGKEPEKFRQIGVTAKEPIEAFMQLADVFKAIEDPQERAAFGAAALGKSWAGVAPLLMEGGEAIGKMVEDGTRLSKVTTESAKAADEFNDRLADLSDRSEAAKTAIVNDLIGPMGDLLAIVEKFQAAKSGGNLFGWLTTGGDEEKDASTRILTLSNSLQKMKADREVLSKDTFANRLNEIVFGDVFDLDQQIAATTKKIEYLQGIARNPVEASGSRTANDAATKPKPPNVRGFLDTAGGAEKTKTDSTLDRLRLEARAQEAGLAPETVKELDALFAANNITLAERNHLIDVAMANDRVLADEQKKVADALNERAQAEQIVANYEKQFSQSIDRIARANEYIGVSEREKQVREALYKLDDEAMRLREEVTRQVKDETARKEKLAEVEAGLADKKRRVAQATRDAYDASRTFDAGWSDALQKYEDSATNTAKTAGDAFTGMTNAMEGAVKSFAKNGKVDIASFGDAVINTLIDIQMQSLRTNVLAPAMQSAGNWLSGLFGGSSSHDANVAGMMQEASNELALMSAGGGYHTGGIVGSEPTFMRNVPRELFNNAPRFHTGGIVGDEVPAILRPGEGVFTVGQMRALGVRAQGGSNVTVNVINNADGTKATQNERSDGSGGRIIDVIVDQVEGKIASNVARGGGSLSPVLERTYGLGRAAGAY